MPIFVREPPTAITIFANHITMTSDEKKFVNLPGLGVFLGSLRSEFDAAVDAKLTEALEECGLLSGQAYGISFNPSDPSATIERVGDDASHGLLPVQSAMRRCLLADDGTVRAYLSPTDSTKKEDGTAADLTGASGQVMVEIPKHWRRLEAGEDGRVSVLLCPSYRPGFKKVPRMYCGAYEATIDRSLTGFPKLCSVANTTAAFRGGNNDATKDSGAVSYLGRPASWKGLADFRAYARNRGTGGYENCGWNVYTYEAAKSIFWLFAVEYASMDAQAVLGAGGTALGTKWGTLNNYNPFIPCGTTNSLGNASGSVNYHFPSGAAIHGNAKCVSYRGLENIYGHLWAWTDGLRVVASVTDDGAKRVRYYATSYPSRFGSSSYELIGELPFQNNGYLGGMGIGPGCEILPTSLDASATGALCPDYVYHNFPATGEREYAVLVGGCADSGDKAGLAAMNAEFDDSHEIGNMGTRLLYLPA